MPSPLNRLLAPILLLTLAACAERSTEPRLPADVEAAWSTLQEQPNDATYLRFLHANRIAAMRHAQDGNPHDAVGVLHQVRALEAQSEQAQRVSDLALAQDVIARVEEIEEGEVIDVYEEVLPGSRARLRSARTAVLPMLE